MTAEWSVPAWAVLATATAVLVVLVALVVLVRRCASRAELALEVAGVQVDALRAEMAAVEQRLSSSARAERRATEATPPEQEYLITRLGHDREPVVEAAPVLDAPLFADLVLRESAVQVASLAAGLRRALAPEHLNRIRFEMRRELKRARKQRRADQRQARREYEARDRAGEVAA